MNTTALEGLDLVAIVALVVVLFYLAPKKIPELARALGSALGYFKKGMKEVNDEIEAGKKL